MSPYHHSMLKLREGCDASIRTIPSSREYAILEELCFVRREAQAEANLAYEDWRVLDSAEAYAVYRAAQDRADAAQDDLAGLVASLAA